MTAKKAATKQAPKQAPKQVAGKKKDVPAKGKPTDEAPAREPRKLMPFDL